MWFNNSSDLEDIGLLENEFIIDNYGIVIGLYIPVFCVAFFANILVIIVVIKYHYMRK